MFETEFLFKLLLSFLFGGALVAAATWAAERFGVEVGGLLAGLPTTVLVSLLFIALTASSEDAAYAAEIIPAALGLAGLFLALWGSLIREAGVLAYVFALAIWLAGAIYLANNPPTFIVSLLIFAGLSSSSYYLLERIVRPPIAAQKKLSFSLVHLLLRAAFAGMMISIAVLLSRIGGPLLGGIFAVFPASYLSTLTIAHRVRGKDFALSLARPLLSSGMINCLVYVLMVRFSYPRLGIVLGTLLSFSACLGSAYFLFRYRARRFTPEI